MLARMFLLAGAMLAVSIPAGAESLECPRPLSLGDVLERVRTAPRALAALDDAEAQRALARQAGARPNPDLHLEVEDFTGSGGYSDFGASQTTLSFAQKIELGGVRDRRVDAATREGDAVAARGAAGQALAEATAKQRYVDLVAGAESLAAASEGARLSRAFLADAERRGASAAASEADVARARVAVATAELAVATGQRDLSNAAERLAASWGGTSADASCWAEAIVRSESALPPVLPSRTIPAGASPAPAPAVAVADAEVETTRAEVALARASAAPDLEVGAGLRYFYPGDVSAVAGMRIEVPIFDRNEGAIEAAERQLAAAQSRALAVRRETDARLVRLRRTLDAAAARERTIRTAMLPSADSAASSLSRAWQGGAASSFEMLDARRTVLDLKQQRIEAAGEYYRTLVAIEAMTGTVSPTLGASNARTED